MQARWCVSCTSCSSFSLVDLSLFLSTRSSAVSRQNCTRACIWSPTGVLGLILIDRLTGWISTSHSRIQNRSFRRPSSGQPVSRLGARQAGVWAGLRGDAGRTVVPGRSRLPGLRRRRRVRLWQQRRTFRRPAPAVKSYSWRRRRDDVYTTLAELRRRVRVVSSRLACMCAYRRLDDARYRLCVPRPYSLVVVHSTSAFAQTDDETPNRFDVSDYLYTPSLSPLPPAPVDQLS